MRSDTDPGANGALIDRGGYFPAHDRAPERSGGAQVQQVQSTGGHGHRPQDGDLVTEPPANPKIPGREPVFRHLDDPEVPWQQVRRQRNADGSEASVREKWPAFSP